MGKAFKTAAAFKMSLEERLRALHEESGAPIQSLRLKVVIERLLARLFAAPDPPWLLKGGYAMELRYRPRARTTKDIDLSVKTLASTLAERLQHVRDELQAAADQDAGDYFVFQIGAPTSELQGAPDGGARFSVNALLAGKSFAKFHLDVGFGDPVLSTPEKLVGQNFLGFAGIAPAQASAIPKAQQFAEKIHAYTKPWTDRGNTRVKDLVDLVLFLTVDAPQADAIRAAVERTFELRATHAIPLELPPPPDAWGLVYDEMAVEAELNPAGMDEGFQLLVAFWSSLASARN
jgi:hypothetical protein